MLLPTRTAVLNYLYGVKNADIDQIMGALKPEYGNERQFTKARYLDHVMSLEANGMVRVSSSFLDKNGEMHISYEINDEGRAAVDKYVDKKYRHKSKHNREKNYMNTSLVIMAAGIGSRFGGGIKQLEPVGPNGEIIMDYSIYDALEAGFNKIVFIIRKDIEEDFKEIIGKRIEKVAPVFYAYQELDDLPLGFTKPGDRTKPWGTGQALLCAKEVIDEPFAVINADDYYGREGFRRIHDYLVNHMDTKANPYDICMAGFVLGNTLSENGGVTRGVCQVDENGILKKVTETYELQKRGDKVEGRGEGGESVFIPLTQNVSMNMWGLSPEFLDELQRGFPVFLKGIEEGDIKSEYLLPKMIDNLVQNHQARVRVLETKDKWFGVTYKEDKEAVAASVKALVSEGVYKTPLF